MTVPTIQQKVRFLFWTLAHVIIFTLILAWVFYPEDYGFFSEFTSNLGGVESDTGLSNQVSSIIFIVGFGCSAALALALGIIYFVSDELRNKPNYIKGFSYVKGAFCIIIMIGAALIAVPHDHSSAFLVTLHKIGAATFIIGFGILNGFCQFDHYKGKKAIQGNPQETKEEKRWRTFNLVIDSITYGILGIAIVFFIVWYILSFAISGSPIFDVISVQLAQKIVLITSLLSVFSLDLEDM